MLAANANFPMPGDVKRICRYIFNDSKSAGLRPGRNDYELNVQEETQKIYAPKTR